MAGGVSPPQRESLLSHGCAVPAPPEGKPRALRTVLAPRIYEGGGPRSGRGSSPAAAGTALSVPASPCQLPQRGSRGRFAPFLPPAFMRGEGHAVAGGVPRSGGESLLSHGFAVPAPPEGKPRALRAVPAPRIYEGGGPRSGRGSSPAAAGTVLSVPASPCRLSQGESQGAMVVPRSHATVKYLLLHENADKWGPCAHFSPVNRVSSFPAFSLCPSRP